MDRVIGGVQITAPTPTVVPYTIQVSVRYNAMQENTQQLQAAVRAAIYAWLDANRLLGQSVHRSAIIRRGDDRRRDRPGGAGSNP